MDDIRGRVTKDGIRIYDDAEFSGMRTAGRVAAEILDMVGDHVKPGVTTAELDDVIDADAECDGDDEADADDVAVLEEVADDEDVCDGEACTADARD